MASSTCGRLRIERDAPRRRAGPPARSRPPRGRSGRRRASRRPRSTTSGLSRAAVSRASAAAAWAVRAAARARRLLEGGRDLRVRPGGGDGQVPGAAVERALAERPGGDGVRRVRGASVGRVGGLVDRRAQQRVREARPASGSTAITPARSAGSRSAMRDPPSTAQRRGEQRRVAVAGARDEQRAAGAGRQVEDRLEEAPAQGCARPAADREARRARSSWLVRQGPGELDQGQRVAGGTVKEPSEDRRRRAPPAPALTSSRAASASASGPRRRRGSRVASPAR